MTRDYWLKILREVDVVEAQMRGLESKLTHLRVKIRREVLDDRQADYVPESEQKTTR